MQKVIDIPDEVDKFYTSNNCENCDIKTAKNMFATLLLAVQHGHQLIRCDECKHFIARRTDSGDYYCACTLTGREVEVPNDGYCFAGQKEES